MCLRMLCPNVKKKNKLVCLEDYTALDGFDSWSKQQIIDTVRPMFGLYCR